MEIKDLKNIANSIREKILAKDIPTPNKDNVKRTVAEQERQISQKCTSQRP